MKKVLKIFIPILFLAIGVGVVGVFEFYLKDKIDTVEVVAANTNIGFKEKINSSDLVIKHVRVDDAVKGAYKPVNVKEIVGRYASIDIEKGTQIYPSLIDSVNLVPNEKKGEFVAPIPNDWLFAVPGSLRKAYVADFYAIQDKDQSMIKNLVNDSLQNKDNQTNKTTSPVETNTQMDSYVMDVSSPILKNVRVASVKDRSNQEVKSAQSDKGASASGIISNIEIIANQDMLNKIRNYTDRGYKIYVVYQFER